MPRDRSQAGLQRKNRGPQKMKRPCLKCARRTVVDTQVCVFCDPPPKTAKAPEARCKECPKITTSKSGYCRRCTPTWLAARKPGPQHALKPPKGLDGRWVNVQGVRRWVTWPVQDVA